jgi:anaerobic ribonucleoside-triphosphate reductase
MMKIAFYFFLLLFCSINAIASEHGLVILEAIYIHQIFDEQNRVDISKLPDFVIKEDKINKCIEEYIRRQSKSYAKNVQSNLYNLIYNFDSVLSSFLGKKLKDNISLEEKIEMLAKMQCDAYYAIGILK